MPGKSKDLVLTEVEFMDGKVMRFRTTRPEYWPSGGTEAFSFTDETYFSSSTQTVFYEFQRNTIRLVTVTHFDDREWWEKDDQKFDNKFPINPDALA